jgi:predicted permease
MTWLSRLLRRNALEKELDRELQFHLDAAAADHVRAGLTPEDARRMARIQFGGPEQVKEATRDSRGTRWVEDFVSDARFAVRGMRRTPVFAAAAILTIAIGVGANTAVFSIMDALLRKSLPVERPEELRAVLREGLDDDEGLISHPLMQRMQAELGSTTPLAGASGAARLYATIAERPEGVSAQLVTGNFFATLGVHAQIGRLFGPADDQMLGGSPVAVITEQYWERRFARDPAVVGRTVRLNGFPMTIIGVLQPAFGGLNIGNPIDFFAPVTMQGELRWRSNAFSDDADPRKPWVPQNGVYWLMLVTRAAGGDSSRIASHMNRVFRANIVATTAGRDSASRARALREHIGLLAIPRGFSTLRTSYRDPLRALFAGVALILVITCANLAGLVLARGEARSHEMAIRSSLGALSGRLTRQVLAETITLALIGGAVGLAVARWLIGALLLLASSGTRAVPLGATLDAPVLLFALAVTLLAALAVALAPAIRVRRFDLYAAFKTGARASAGSHRLPLGRVLVMSQIALALILVSAAGVFVRTFQNFLDIDTGFERASIVTARVDMLAAGYSYDELPGVHQRLLDAVRAVPGVQSASLARFGISMGQSISTYAGDRPLPTGRNRGQENAVSPGYFRTMGIPLLRGRDFTSADVKSNPSVAIVSESFAMRFFGTVDAVGRRFDYAGDGQVARNPQFEVVGVVRDIRQNGVKESQPRMVYRPLTQATQEYIQSIDVRVAGRPEAVTLAVRNAIGGVDARLPIRDVVPATVLIERGLTRERMVARLAGGFGLLALILAAVGLYGVISYSVARRTNEMGVRLALGATPGGVSWLVLRDSLVLVAAGLAVGLVLWFPVLGLTRSLLYDVSPHDPRLLAISLGLLLLVGVVAGLVPAWRAARIDPIEAIRAD